VSSYLLAVTRSIHNKIPDGNRLRFLSNSMGPSFSSPWQQRAYSDGGGGGGDGGGRGGDSGTTHMSGIKIKGIPYKLIRVEACDNNRSMPSMSNKQISKQPEINTLFCCKRPQPKSVPPSQDSLPRRAYHNLHQGNTSRAPSPRHTTPWKDRRCKGDIRPTTKLDMYPLGRRKCVERLQQARRQDQAANNLHPQPNGLQL
jgi:hypothetical protein